VDRGIYLGKWLVTTAAQGTESFAQSRGAGGPESG
jgi:hypothetical protein